MPDEEIKKLIKAPVKYDGMMYVFDADGNMILQVRGWGRLQYLSKPEEKQDGIGYFIAAAINEKLAKTDETV